MKKALKLTVFAATAIIFSALWSCSDDNENYAGDPPTELEVARVLDITADLRWKGTASSYEVSVGGKSQVTSQTSITVDGLTPTTGYKWRVRAVYEDGYSKWVDGPKFETMSTGDIDPDMPTGLSMTDLTWHGATFSWEGQAAKYELVTDDRKFEVTGHTFTVEDLEPETEYQWRVRAILEADSYSEWANGTVFETLPLPTMRIRVTFDGQETEFNYAETLKATYSGESAFIFGLFYDLELDTEGIILPCLRFSCDPEVGKTNDPYNYKTSVSHFFEYYDENYMDAPIQDGDGYAFGNWWSKSGTVNITSITEHELGNYVSGVAEMTLENAYDINDGVATPETKTIKVEFDNIAYYLVDLRTTKASASASTWSGWTWSYAGYPSRIGTYLQPLK